MTVTRSHVSLVAVLGLLAVCAFSDASLDATAAEEPAEPKLIPVEAKTIAARQESLSQSGPEGAKLVAYLDCGSQLVSTTTDEVTISWVSGAAYKFPSEAKDVLPTQPIIFFDASQVPFEIDGLKRTEHYLVGLTWWDYDDGQRTQSVVVGSPDGRLVRLAVPAIRLPNYTSDGQLPAELRFRLPATFAREGKMRLTVRAVTGANVVISELWIWQLGQP